VNFKSLRKELSIKVLLVITPTKSMVAKIFVEKKIGGKSYHWSNKSKLIAQLKRPKQEN
jgi:hypothetical protein